jgi:lipopolysaccharide biosynthesis regulator YciM
MTQCNKKLKILIEDTVMPDIEDAIDDVFEEIASNKNANQEQEEQLEEFHEMRKEFTEILEDINNDDLEEDECKELLIEITKMIEEEDEK